MCWACSCRCVGPNLCDFRRFSSLDILHYSISLLPDLKISPTSDSDHAPRLTSGARNDLQVPAGNETHRTSIHTL